jgi:hypothetical protein
MTTCITARLEVDGLKVFYREARKVDAHLSCFYCTDYPRPRANEASTANQSSRHSRPGLRSCSR